MRKRNKNKWHKRTYCSKCKGFATRGGLKFWFIKITEWSNECRCLRYDSTKPTELDKQKCEEVLKEQENNNGNENK